MAGKVKNEVEGQAKVSGEESLESFYSSIVGILSAMQVSEPYAQLFATALTTASNNADPGAIEKYTAALKKFNSAIAKSADLVKKGILPKKESNFSDDTILTWTKRAVPKNPVTRMIYSRVKNSSGEDRNKAFKSLTSSVRMIKADQPQGTEKTTDILNALTALFTLSDEEMKRLAPAMEKLKKSMESAAKPIEEASKAAEESAKRIEQAEKKASSRKTRTVKTAKEAPVEEASQDEKPRARKRITVDTREKSGEGLLKKAEKAKNSAKNIRQLADIEADIYKELSDSKDVSVSANFKALLDRKANGAGDKEISTYAAMLSKSVNQGVSVSPKKVDRIHSLVNEWNVANRYNEIRKEAHMPSMAVSGLNSVMPELKFLASPFGTDKMAVSGSKIPALEKQIGRINNNDKLNPETKLEKIREAIDSAFTMQTKGTADLMEIAESAQKQAEKNTQEIEKIKAQKPAEKAPAEAAVQQETAEVFKGVDSGREMEDFRSRWGRIVQDNAPAPETEGGQALENANINVTNGYFDIDKLANAINGKDNGDKIGKLTGKDLFNAMFEQPKKTNVNDATFGNRALTLTDQGELILGKKDDILAWINDPTNVLQFIQAALGKKISSGNKAGEVLTSNDIYKGLTNAAKEAFGEGGFLGFIDRGQIESSLRTSKKSYDNDTVNKIWGDRAYASGTISDVLSSKNLLTDAQKRNILAGLLGDKGTLDYDRVGIVKSLTYSGRKEGWDNKHREQNLVQSMSENMRFSTLNKRMAREGFSQDQIDFVNSFKGNAYGKQLANQVYSFFLEGIKGELAKRNSDWALEDTRRKAMRNGVTSYTDALGNTVDIGKAGPNDIDYIKRAIKLKPQQDIESLASSMDENYLRKILETHINKYIDNLSQYDTRYLGRKDRVKDLKSRTDSTQRLIASDSVSKLDTMVSDRILKLLTSGLSDKKILSELGKLKNGGIEPLFKDFFDDIDKRVHTALDNVDDLIKQKGTESGTQGSGNQKGRFDIDEHAPFLSVYENEQYKLNSGMIQEEERRLQQLRANRNGASEDETKKINSEINKSINVIEALRKQNKALETQAKNLADEQKRTRMSFGKSVTQSIKAGLYRWNQNSQSRGGIAGAFAKFGANRMEGGALQKLLGVNVGGILGLAAAEGGRKIAQAVSRGIKESLADFGNVQTIQTNLGTVYGSQSAADMRFADIAKYATKSPFGVQQTSDFAVLLKQSGVYENDLMKTLSMIGDVAGGNQEKYSRIANNYAQIVAANKATAMDLRQFANAGIPIYKAIKDYLASQDKEKYGGLDTAAVRKMTQNGEITSDVIEGVFRMLTSEGGAFNNSVQRGAKTYKAQMQNMQDIRQLAGAAVGEWVFGFGRNDGRLTLDSESKSIFQNILDTVEEIYNKIDSNVTKQNLKDKSKTAENDATRRAVIQSTLKYFKDNPDMDPSGEGKKYFEELLKNYVPTYDYAERRSINAQLYDVYDEKANEARDKVDRLPEVQSTLYSLIRRENDLKSQLQELSEPGNRDSKKYNELEKALSENSLALANVRQEYEELIDRDYSLTRAINKNTERMEKSREEAYPYLYWKNQTLAESAMSTAYGMAAKSEGLDRNSAQSISSWIDEQYKGTDAYKQEQKRRSDENIERGESIAKWQKANNVSESNMFGFIANEKNISDLAKHLAESFVSEEGKTTREYVTDENGNLTKEGKAVMENMSGLIKGIFSNPELSRAFNGITVTRREADGSEGTDLLRSLLWDVGSFAANPRFGTYDKPSAEESKYYADVASLQKVLDDLNSKTTLTDQEEWLKTILSKTLSPQTLATVDTSKLKAIEEAQTKEYIPLWKRIANQSLGVPIQMLTNNRSNVGSLYDKVRTRNQTGQIATAMLQSGSSFDRVADMMSYTGAMNSRINGGASSTGQVDWQKTAMNMRDFALSLSSATEVTSAYVSSLSEQQSQVYSILTGWKSMEDFDKMTDEKLKDNLGQIQQWSKNTVTAYQSTFGYSGAAEDLDKNVIDTLYKIENSNGKERRVYLDKLTQQMAVLSEMLKTQRKTAETVLSIKSSMKDLRQQTESNEDEIFLNTVSTVGSGVPEFSGMRPEAETALWKSLLNSVNSQQTLVQAYDTDSSGRLSYNELKKNLPDILEELRSIGKNTEGTNKNIGKLAMKPVEKVSIPSIENKVETKSLEGLSKDEQARELIKAVKSGTGKDTLNSLYKQTSFNALDWGRYAKDNGLSLDQARSVTRSSSGDIPFIERGFSTASGGMKLAAESVTVQAKEVGVQGPAENALEQLSSSADNLADSMDSLAYSNMYTEAYRKLGEPDAEYKNANNIETDMSQDRKQLAMRAFDAPFVMPIMNGLFGGKDGTRFLPYTDFSGNIMTQVGTNTRNQQRALNFLDWFGFSGAGSKSMSNFVNGSISSWGSGANFNEEAFNRDSASLLQAANYAGVEGAGTQLDSMKMLLENGGQDSIEAAKQSYEELVEEMYQGDIEKGLGDQLKNLSQSMKETFSSNLFNGINDSFAQIGKNLKDGKNASDGMYKIWKNVGREITGTIGATLTTTGLNIASSAALDKKWGLVAAGLAMAASGGICSIASGLMSDSSDSSEDSKDNGEEQRIQNLKDALSDLIDQAKTDAEYYEKNLLHKNALSANEAVSTRSVNDAIITPGGDIVTTHPDDYLIATKTPGSLMGSGGQANVTVQVNPVVINNSSANITAKTETRENDDGSVDIVTTIVDVMNMALATGKADEGMAAYEANRNGRSVVS